MILSSDWHIRKTRPIARVDDYFSAQERKIRFILELARQSPPLLIAGDFFHQPKPGPFLEQWIINLFLEYEVYPIVTPGQHDLPGHNLEQINDSGLGVLAAAGVIQLLTNPQLPTSFDDFVIEGCSYGLEPEQIFPTGYNKNMTALIWHHMVIQDSPLWPGQVADRADTIIKRHRFDLMVTGDNHQTFTTSHDGRWLVNPGSIMRMTAAQVDHKPCVFRWENRQIERINLPIEEMVFDLSQLEQSKEKDKRIQAFVTNLNQQYDIDLSFERNLSNFFEINNIKREVKDLVWTCCGTNLIRRKDAR